MVYDVDASFRSGSYRTMAPDPRRDRVLIREGMRPLSPELHLRATLAELTGRNYQSVPAAEADLWVTVYVLMGGRLEGGHAGGSRASHGEGSGESQHRGGRGGAGRPGPPPSGREGGIRGDITVVILLEDRKTGRPVWHGELSLDPKDKDAEGHPLGIEAAVHQLMQPLPSLP